MESEPGVLEREILLCATLLAFGMIQAVCGQRVYNPVMSSMGNLLGSHLPSITLISDAYRRIARSSIPQRPSSTPSSPASGTWFRSQLTDDHSGRKHCGFPSGGARSGIIIRLGWWFTLLCSGISCHTHQPFRAISFSNDPSQCLPHALTTCQDRGAEGSLAA